MYSEAQDGKPKPVPASDFVAYFKSKAINGAAVLRKEFKASPNYTCHLISNHLLGILVSQTLAKAGYNSAIQVKAKTAAVRKWIVDQPRILDMKILPTRFFLFFFFLFFT